LIGDAKTVDNGRIAWVGVTGPPDPSTMGRLDPRTIGRSLDGGRNPGGRIGIGGGRSSGRAELSIDLERSMRVLVLSLSLLLNVRQTD
jgi:hypothetical protein